MKIHFCLYPLLGIYNDGAKQELRLNLEMQGLKEKSIGMGGGADIQNVKEVIVAWIDMHPIISSLLLGVIANRIDKLIDYTFHWHQYYAKSKEVIPKIMITIYKSYLSKKSTTIELYANKRISKTEIIRAIKQKK